MEAAVKNKDSDIDGGASPPKVKLPKGLRDFFIEMGGLAYFTGKFFRQVFKPPYQFKEIFKQAYETGYTSLPLVSITSFIIGLVLTIQSRPTLVKFGAESMLPGMVAVSLVREICPVVVALICAGKISSRIGAELGSMKVTEQIDAMEVSGTNPFKHLVVTRVLSTTLMVPMLILYGDFIGIIGGYVGENIKGNISSILYFTSVIHNLDFSDFLPAFIKTFFFGFCIGLVGCFKGYNTEEGTEGVGKSANQSVVIASLIVFILDMMAVQITDLIY
jgi:phospholipid/cholesterol/gamma-HCH transport system permease protein